MEILMHELKKIVLFPALIGFIAICLLLNVAVVSTMGNSYANYIAHVSHTTGIRLGADFNERVTELEPGLYADLLRLQTTGVVDVLDGYTIEYIADAAVYRLGLSGVSERLMREKYRAFQYAVDARQEAGDSMTLYFAGATFGQHERLFSYTMGLLLFQGVTLSVLIMLLTLGFEHAAKTDYVVYSTKVGRKIGRHKLLSGMIVGLGTYILLASVTLAQYFAFNPMGGTWGSSVSSGFNFIRETLGTRPFVTWHSFTVFEYLFASIGVSLAIVLCFSLMAYAFGLWIQNSYIGFLVLVALNGVLILFPYYSNLWMLNFTITQSPIWLVVMRSLWFTDGGSNVVWPHFETVGIIGSLALLVLTSLWSTSRFRRRDLL